MEAQLAKFTKSVREIINLLEKYTRNYENEVASTKIWNGKEYAPYSGEKSTLEPYALCWFGMLTTLSEMIERQNSDLTEEQYEYIKTLLFGGMGSLTDFQFKKMEDEREWKKDNKELNVKINKSYSIFIKLKHG